MTRFVVGDQVVVQQDINFWASGLLPVIGDIGAIEKIMNPHYYVRFAFNDIALPYLDVELETASVNEWEGELELL